ncbi:MAG: DegT/DnrJ/EryC1/StrS family aminotransferase [Phycisphaerales bacterium]|nr:MAG: DegT/DnrJ/EryC1/StrS family aminotransferase [Phycisphaerales bacterium]
MAREAETKNKLALLGGEKAVKSDQADMFTWPIVTERHEKAVLDVLRAGQMSGFELTKEFEKKYAQMLGRKYGLAYHNGTAAILGAMYGLGIGVGDEIIVPSLTYWATAAPAYTLGATPVFADVDPDTICIDPKDIEHRITPRTKAIMVVHYAGMPADMDAIEKIAAKHNLKIIEDCSHAHGALYKGKEIGTFGDTAAFSLMTGKSLAVGEAGILFTDDRQVYERALLFGHYIRHDEITLPELKPFVGLPCGGYKHRMHQLSSAFGLVQLELYAKQMAEIDKAMHYFCDLLEDTSGIRPIRPPKGGDTTKGGWYFPLFKYLTEELEGLSLSRFSEAVRAEGSICNPGCNKPLHVHPFFTTMDVYGHGRPTRIAYLDESAKMESYVERLPVAESINRRVFGVPWFKHHRPDIIREHADAYRKVVTNYRALLPGDSGGDAEIGQYSTFFTSRKDTQ